MALSLLRLNNNLALTRHVLRKGCYYEITPFRFLTAESASEKPEPKKVKQFLEREVKIGGNVGLSKRERLKIMIKDYGKTVIVFHVAMSLVSLGLFYAAVSNGIDMTPVIKFITFGDDELAQFNTTIANSSTFLVAYTMHKLFAPVRISITLAVTPLLVKRLRLLGILKHAIPAVDVKK